MQNARKYRVLTPFRGSCYKVLLSSQTPELMILFDFMELRQAAVVLVQSTNTLRHHSVVPSYITQKWVMKMLAGGFIGDFRKNSTFLMTASLLNKTMLPITFNLTHQLMFTCTTFINSFVCIPIFFPFPAFSSYFASSSLCLNQATCLSYHRSHCCRWGAVNLDAAEQRCHQLVSEPVTHEKEKNQVHKRTEQK